MSGSLPYKAMTGSSQPAAAPLREGTRPPVCDSPLLSLLPYAQYDSFFPYLSLQVFKFYYFYPYKRS